VGQQPVFNERTALAVQELRRGRDRRVLAAAVRFETTLEQSGLWKGRLLQNA
jgi:hypothetical protein